MVLVIYVILPNIYVIYIYIDMRNINLDGEGDDVDLSKMRANGAITRVAMRFRYVAKV